MNRLCGRSIVGLMTIIHRDACVSSQNRVCCRSALGRSVDGGNCPDAELKWPDRLRPVDIASHLSVFLTASNQGFQRLASGLNHAPFTPTT